MDMMESNPNKNFENSINERRKKENPPEFYDDIMDNFQPEIERLKALDQEEFIKTARKLLHTIMIHLREKYGADTAKETTHHFLPDPNDAARENPLVVLGTGRCSYAETGGCSMCGFGESERRNVSENEINDAFDFAREHNDKYPDHAVFNINANGSFFNEKELLPARRKSVWAKIKTYKDQNPEKKVIFVTESRFEDINEEKLIEMRKELGNDIPIEIGFGVESTNELIREAIVGKGLDPEWEEKLELLKKYKMDSALHIMFGLPFLDKREQISDSVSTIKDCLSATEDFDRILMMVMNRKPGTLIDALMKKDEYQLPTISMVAETVIRLGRELTEKDLKRISVFGFEFSKELAEVGTKTVEYRDKNEKAILDILLKWRGTSEELRSLETAFSSLPPDIYDQTLLNEPLPDIKESEIKENILKQYFRMLAEINCSDQEDAKSAADHLRKTLNITQYAKE